MGGPGITWPEEFLGWNEETAETAAEVMVTGVPTGRAHSPGLPGTESMVNRAGHPPAGAGGWTRMACRTIGDRNWLGGGAAAGAYGPSGARWPQPATVSIRPAESMLARTDAGAARNSNDIVRGPPQPGCGYSGGADVAAWARAASGATSAAAASRMSSSARLTLIRCGSCT